MSEKSIESIAKELIRVAGTKTVEQSYSNPRGCILFSDKVALMEQYPFLRTFESLTDLEETIEIQKKVLLMGTKEYQAEANKWMSANNKALDTHQNLRKQLDSAKHIDSVFGKEIPFTDPDTVEIFRKCRRDSLSETVKPGFLGIGYERKKRAYDSDTDAAVELLESMQKSYKEFIESLNKEFESSDKNEFFMRNSYLKYLRN